jgi:ankyrin repeat protein
MGSCGYRTVLIEHGTTTLHQASCKGHISLARFLFKHGADPIAQDKHGSTPLYRTLISGNAGPSFERGADATVQDKDGQTLLCQASREGRLDLVRVLVEDDTHVTAYD